MDQIAAAGDRLDLEPKSSLGLLQRTLVANGPTLTRRERALGPLFSLKRTMGHSNRTFRAKMG